MSRKAKIISWILIAIISPFVLYQLIMGFIFFISAIGFFFDAIEKGYNHAVCETCTSKDAFAWSVWFYPILFILYCLIPLRILAFV